MAIRALHPNCVSQTDWAVSLDGGWAVLITELRKLENKACQIVGISPEMSRERIKE
jgi:hypothetical protein